MKIEKTFGDKIISGEMTAREVREGFRFSDVDERFRYRAVAIGSWSGTITIEAQPLYGDGDGETWVEVAQVTGPL